MSSLFLGLSLALAVVIVLYSVRTIVQVRADSVADYMKRKAEREARDGPARDQRKE